MLSGRLRDLTAMLLALVLATAVGTSVAQAQNAEGDGGAGARESQGEWLTDPKTGCRIWNGYPEPGESVRWDGPCEDGYAHGQGTLHWYLDGEPNGQYVGERVHGKAHGYGINTWANGDRYEGYWAEDQPHGQGTYAWADGSAYQGGWVNGKKHGQAVYIWANGDRFEGSYKNDKPFGGIYIKADGTRYIAEVSGNSIGPGPRFFTPEERKAVRTVGNMICRPNNYFFGMIDATVRGFVEQVEDDRIKIRIASTGTWFESYKGIALGQNTILWDDADNWQVCPEE